MRAAVARKERLRRTGAVTAQAAASPWVT